MDWELYERYRATLLLVGITLTSFLMMAFPQTPGVRALNTFLGEKGSQSGTPFVIGVAGSVAVGKSTVARLLQALLSRWPEHPRVELVTTDGFLLPTKDLEARGLMSRKGFPESYDRRALTRVDVMEIASVQCRGHAGERV